MDPDTVINIGRQTLEVIGMLTGMVLLPALAVGLLIAMFQAATQINEMTLTFIPKLVVVGAGVDDGGPLDAAGADDLFHQPDREHPGVDPLVTCVVDVDCRPVSLPGRAGFYSKSFDQVIHAFNEAQLNPGWRRIFGH